MSKVSDDANKAAMDRALKDTPVESVAPAPGAVVPPPWEGKAPDTPPVAPATPPSVVAPPATPPVTTGIPDFLVPTPVVAPVVTPPPADDPPGMTDNQKVNFSNLRKAKEAAELAKTTAEQKLALIYDAEGKLKPDFLKTLASPDVESLKAERDAALDRVAKFDLQSDPRWIAKYAQSENAANQSVLRIAKEFGVEAEDVQKAMAMPLKERMKYFSENMPDAVPLVSQHLARLDEIREQKAVDIASAKQTNEQIRMLNTAQREQKVAEARTAIHAQVSREMEEAGIFAFKPIVGNDAWNKGVEGTRARFAELLASNDVITQSRALAQAAALPAYQVAVTLANDLIKQLRQQLALHAGAGPSIHTPNGAPAAGGPVDASTMTPAQLAAANVNSAIRRTG